MLSFQRWWKHAKVKLTMCGDDLFSLSPDLHLALWAHGVSADVQDPLVLSEGLTLRNDRGHILLHFSCRVVHDGIPRVHVVEEKVFGPRFPGALFWAPRFAEGWDLAYAEGFKGKLSEQWDPGRLLLLYFLKIKEAFEAYFQAGSGSLGRGLKAGQKGLQGSGKEWFHYGSWTPKSQRILSATSFATTRSAH